MSNPVSVGDDLVARLEFKAQVAFDANKKDGRRGKEWAITEELEWKAAAAIREAASQLAALRHDNSDLLAAADADAFTIGTLEAQLKAAREALEMIAVISWLENGCDPIMAAKELRIYQDRAALNPKAPS